MTEKSSPAGERGADTSCSDTKTLELVTSLTHILRPDVELGSLQISLSTSYERIREDPSRLDMAFDSFQSVDIIAGMVHLIERRDINAYTADKASFVLSSLISRAPSYTFDLESIGYYVRSLIHGTSHLSELGRLDSLANVLKIASYRELVWDAGRTEEMLFNNLRMTSHRVPLPVANIYKAAFCVWLFSFSASFIPLLNKAGLIACLCEVIKETRVEKIVRVCLATIKNVLANDDAAETIIELDVFQVLTLLEYEKWKDMDLYEDIREGIHLLDQKIKHFSNFDRYCLELDKSKLKWSVLHSEKFWHENVMCFEHDEFSAVRKLVKLLDSADSTTVAVAAYDLGEFARLHPTGKRVCQKLKVKDMVMLLIANRDRSIAREALLCIQKLMLKNWQAIAGGGVR
eukprot:GHVS01056760.1.p1 GENE.GHVS01056760.1~~GHVS01056760.1.p1  ORF type:complete len:403 (+),score=41.38 GHVS01056760.1:131-1339(+)